MRARSKIWIEKNKKLIFGEGKSEIFKAIQEHKSINKAAKSMGVSFRHAWSYINEIEKRLGVHLVDRSKGGKGGGGSHLTEYAVELMKRFDRLKNEVDKYTDKKAKEVFGGWKNMRY
ncbi:MAG: LysR family transcriptional regulator [Candidatus Omnitrophica bacterium]|nr:LysR family transcriptional regulator [Candidatus Omnitrophota bacterium]